MGLVTISVNSACCGALVAAITWTSNCWTRFRYEQRYVWCKFMWFTTNCEAVGEGLLYIANLGGLKNVTIGNKLLQASRGARSWYFAHLAANKDAEEKVSEEKTLEIKKIQGCGSRSPSYFGWLVILDQIVAERESKTCRRWSQSQNLDARALNLSTGYTDLKKAQNAKALHKATNELAEKQKI